MESNDFMKFDLPKEFSSTIKVLGVGGGGSNAVNHMFNSGIRGVDFLVCNTDQQALDSSPVPLKVQLGVTLTDGKGAGSKPEMGKNAAIENLDEIKEVLSQNTDMVFITAGMGGGTGTGAAPVIGQAAKELGILTVGIVTIPFSFEGKKRRKQASEGLAAMRDAVDTLLVISNDKLFEVYGKLNLREAFSKADDVLAIGARGIAEMISVGGLINVDMNDVRTVMCDSGVAVMGNASAEGEDKAKRAVEAALESPLLNDNNIQGAKDVLLNITVGNEDVPMEDFQEIVEYIQDEAGEDANVIWGYVVDESLGDKIGVTVIATGFQATEDLTITQKKEEAKRVNLEDKAVEIRDTMKSPTQETTAEPYLKANEYVQETPQINVSENVTKIDEVEEKVVTNLDDEVTEPTTEQPNLFGNDTLENDQSFTFEFDETKENKMESPSIQSIPNESSQPNKVYLHLDDEAEVDTEEVEASNEAPRAEEKISAPAREIPNQPMVEELTPEQRQAILDDRLKKIQDLKRRLGAPGEMSELEKNPAIERSKFKFNFNLGKKHSEEKVSRFSIDSNNKLNTNNSFLHDNVD